MARARRSTETKLARLRSLRALPSSPELLQELHDALADPSNLVVAEAAAMAGEARLVDLAPALTAAFDPFLVDPVKTDKLCRAKIAIAEALNQMEFEEEDLFWRGARHIQLEPIWGGKRDTAAPLRVSCAFSLVRIHARGALPLLVDLLTDPVKDARLGAVQALAYSETEAAGLLLRLKARMGDPEPEIVSECFTRLFKLTPDDAVAFVAGFLKASDSAVQESALLALGDSRRPEAFEVLKAFWEGSVDSALQETALMALSLLRLPAATAFLVSLIDNGIRPVAEAAISALAVHRYDERLRERIAAMVRQKGREALQGHFEERFRLQLVL
jgi:HEAT repeat protein